MGGLEDFEVPMTADAGGGPAPASEVEDWVCLTDPIVSDGAVQGLEGMPEAPPASVGNSPRAPSAPPGLPGPSVPASDSTRLHTAR